MNSNLLRVEDDTELYRVFSICMRFIDTEWSAMAVKKAVHNLATIVFVVQFLHVDQKDFSILELQV